MKKLIKETIATSSLKISKEDLENVSDEDVRQAKLLIKERGQFVPVIVKDNFVVWNEAVFLAMRELKKKTVWIERRNIVDVNLLFVNPVNSKIHDEENIEDLANSLRRFGQQKPITFRSDGMILTGNGTYLATKKLGWKKIWAELSNLESYEADAYAIADNKLSERSAWDWQNVAETLKAIEEHASIEDLGFPEKEIQNLLKEDWNANEPIDVQFKAYDESVADDVEHLECPECGHKFLL